jgi:5'-nucleotidase (lipoprotein e(P4) family)
MHHRSAVALLALALSTSFACGGDIPPPRVAPPPPPQGATAQAPTGVPIAAAPAPSERLEIRWVRASAEYEALVRQVYRQASAHVERAAAGRAAGSWAVVLDADETVISNLTYQIEQAGKPYDETTWQAWARRREATPLPGAAAFLARVRALGGRIAIVTNRRAPICDDTKAVFDGQGLAYDQMLCREDSGDKNPRFEAVASGRLPSMLPPLVVLAFVGDNITDFPKLSQAIRGTGDDAFSEFGARYFVLPNPMYGSW